MAARSPCNVLLHPWAQASAYLSLRPHRLPPPCPARSGHGGVYSLSSGTPRGSSPGRSQLLTPGPFRACHDIVKPHDFYRNCLSDLCLSNGARSILCQVLETYVATCQKHGAMVHDWRTPSGFSSLCSLTFPATCDQPCVETYACNTGHVLSGGQCVPVSHCGCTCDGCYYHPGEEFWGDDTCRSRCRCDMELGMVVCEDSGCKLGEVCTVVKGVRRCMANRHSICVATGDPHYITFDGHCCDFMGTCVYLLAELCSTDPTLIPFAVTVENNHCGSHLVSFTKVVTHHGGVFRWVSKSFQGMVGFQDPCMVFRWVSKSLGWNLGGLQSHCMVSFYVCVIIPNTYTGAVCGLCGNANGDSHDDFVTCDIHHADNETHLESQRCPWMLSWVQQGLPGIIDPSPYLDDCLFDSCLYEGHQDTVCQAIAAYVAVCQSQGAALRPWRTAAFCSMGGPGGLGRVQRCFRGERGTQGLGYMFWAVRGGIWGVWQGGEEWELSVGALTVPWQV
uniref:VWFD domain-containing protein n=1 Tax=Serinus canaria TaxID=9135 RepID=A0A8C9KS42_SERCA